jgi:hypothetical protein
MLQSLISSSADLRFFWLQLRSFGSCGIPQGRRAAPILDPQLLAILAVLPDADRNWADCARLQDILPRIGFLSNAGLVVRPVVTAR